MKKETSRREFLKKLGGGAALASLTGASGIFQASCSKKAPDKPPNILLLFTDDQRFDTIAALGNSQIRTPHLDRLVKRGMTFTRVHIMGGTSGAVCVPSRAMLLTGKSLFHLENQGNSIPEDHVMLPEVLAEAGYRTIGIGKWHNGRKAYARCFQAGGPVFFGGMSDHLQVPVHDFDPSGEYGKENARTGEKFSSELFADAAVRAIENRMGSGPFFLYVSFTAPHDPRMAPEDYVSLYPPNEIALPPNFLPGHPFDNGEMEVRDEMLAPFPRTPEVIREHIAAYYAMITHLDAQIGRILDALERSGKADNTLIVFAGDNGLAVGQHGLLGKQSVYDHSVRVPLIISGPGIPEDRRSDSLCYLLDIFPTLCDMLELQRPEEIDGTSLLPAIKEPGQKVRSSVMLAYTRLQRGIRTDNDWKLIEYNVRGNRITQLFNLRNDPWETQNLARVPEHEARRDSLRKLLGKSMRENDDFCDLSEPNWGLPVEKAVVQEVRHLAVGRTVETLNGTQPRYSGDGFQVLTDGLRGTSRFRDRYWVGLEGEDLDIRIDLGLARPVRKISVGFLEDQNSWIFFPMEVEFFVSPDGLDFRSVGRLTNPCRKNEFAKVIRDFSSEVPESPARWVRVKGMGVRVCPDWHAGAGRKAWLFSDEVIVD